MKQRTRPSLPNQFHKFLKPGALARIRDSKITARSNRINSLSQISIYRPPSSPPPPPPSSTAQPQPITAADGFPYFGTGIYGPRCPQRKKLVAAKSVFFVPGSPAADSTDLVVDSFGSGDIIAAN